ncbi:MAG: metallophosphoesterase [Saprospiraceae bacterium]|nr:metallophosphoesterase [Saprospiraceae bacterium]
MRTLVIGDIHGNIRALDDALHKAKFDITTDRIICIGDYIDGWEESFEVVRTLLEIKNQSKLDNIFLLGNHDKWFLDILEKDFYNLRNRDYIAAKYPSWYYQGGRATYDSYLSYPDEFIRIHKEDFFSQLKYYHQENNMLFVHAGFLIELGFKETLRTNKEQLLWDRSLYTTAHEVWKVSRESSSSETAGTEIAFDNFDAIFIGHTPTFQTGIFSPTRMANVVNVDQGCKKTGVLTIWELETGRYYQSS